MNKVAITGIGIIDNLGNNVKDCADSYFSKSYIDPTPIESEIENFKHLKAFQVSSDFVLPEIPSKVLRTLNNDVKLGIHAVHQALKDIPHSSNVAVIASCTSAGNQESYNEAINLSTVGRMKKPKETIAGMKHFLPSFINKYYGFNGAGVTMQAACITGMYVIDYAMRLVDEYDYVVCVASDDTINPLNIGLFSSIGALGSHSAPFEESRDGFVFGNAGACFVLQAESKLQKDPIAWLYPAGFSADVGATETAPSSEGTGAKISMQKALAHVNKESIDFVNAHATSTPVGDDIELNAIQEVLGDIEIIAPKRKIGHTMGTSSIIESIYGIEKCKRENKKMFINNSFAFGGKCGAQVIELA
jgi:3-oxoacyl-[acyl-carrier-protein] synthase II